VPFFFGIAIFTNIKLLQAASVETAIVFRTIVPIFTSAADWIWMGRALPELRSACGLAIVVGGSLVYAATSNDGIIVHTWLWAWSYVLVLSFEMVYVRCPHPDSDLLRRAQHFTAPHIAAPLIAEAGQHLGVAIANLLNLLNPGVVVLGGTLATAGETLLRPLRQAMARRSLFTSLASTQVRVSPLGDHAIALGAAGLVLHEALEEPERLLAPVHAAAAR
jgi:hypothetical protein